MNQGICFLGEKGLLLLEFLSLFYDDVIGYNLIFIFLS